MPMPLSRERDYGGSSRMMKRAPRQATGRAPRLILNLHTKYLDLKDKHPYMQPMQQAQFGLEDCQEIGVFDAPGLCARPTLYQVGRWTLLCARPSAIPQTLQIHNAGRL